MKQNLLFILLIIFGSAAISKTLSTQDSVTILVDGRIINKKAATDPFSDNLKTMLTIYEVVHDGRFYICYTGIWPRGRTIDKLIEGVKVKCTGTD